MNVTGIFPYRPATATPKIVATFHGNLYTYEPAGIVNYGPIAGLSTTAPVQMVQAWDTVYGTDGSMMFRFDGTTLSAVTINDSGGNAITNVSSLLYMLNRLWIGSGDQVYFSDPMSAFALPVVSIPSLSIDRGQGDTIGAMLPYRGGLLLIFKISQSGNGSITVADVSTNDPTKFTLYPQAGSLSITSPLSIIPVSNITGSDVVFPSRDGFRTVSVTALDKLQYPSLPFSVNLDTWMEKLNWAAMGTAFAVVFEDELMWFVPVDQATTPSHVFDKRLSPDVPSMYHGWTVLDMMPATCGCVIGFGGRKPSLYVGGENGIIRKAFVRDGSSRYLELSKRIDFDTPDRKKTPVKLYIQHDANSVGTITASLVYQDSNEYVLGNRTILPQGGLHFPLHFPFKFTGGVIVPPQVFDLHHDVNGLLLTDFYDVRVKIISTDRPRFLGFELLAKTKQYRYGDETDIETVSAKSGTLFAETFNAGALAQL